jgi:nucleoside-diphosphate-sugar epimerase
MIMGNLEPQQPVILITGASGLLGSRVVPCLSQEIPGCQIIAITRGENRAPATDSQLITVSGDLRDAQLWASLPTTITHVVHLAAVIPWKAEDRYRASLVTDNLLPLAHLIEHSQGWPNLKQIIYSSSVSVYGQSSECLTEDSPLRPANLYGASKLAGEELLHCFDARGIRTVSLRFSSLYATGQYAGTVLPIMISRALQGQELLIFGDGKRTQDFLHCEDAARLILLAFKENAHGVYNAGTGAPVSMTELAETVSRVFSAGKAPVSHQLDKADNDPGLKLDVSRANRELHFQPFFQLANGLEQLKQEMENTTT